MDTLKCVLITGGAGFVGNALAQKLASKMNTSKIYVLDNFSASQNHPAASLLLDKQSIQFEGITYIKGDTCDIKTKCKDLCPDIVFHFGEFSRINESWSNKNSVYRSNLLGTSMVLDYCVDKKSLLVYSASSAILCDSNETKQLQSTPYTFTKSVMVDMIRHYSSWYDLKYIITYFYNVYGPGQVEEGIYSTVMGIFENCFKHDKNLPVVEPGTQSRIFTHIDDIINGIIYSVKLKIECGNSITDVPICSTDECTIKELALKFVGEDKIDYLPSRKGDRVKSVKVLADVLRENGWNSRNNLDDYIRLNKGLNI
jgi:UDP-glucose 4-epimerase